MTNAPNPEATPADPESELFYSRALVRILRVILVAGAILLLPMYWIYHWPGAIGFAAGAVVSYVNLRVLERGVEGLLDRVANRQSRERGGVIVWRFVARYGLVAAVAYAIFKGSALAFRGFLWGLCLPVAGMMVEACCEAYVAFFGQNPKRENDSAGS